MRSSKQPLLCELHAHSTWSDGELSLPALVDLYGRGGFDVLCVTDHVWRSGGRGHIEAGNHTRYLDAIAAEAKRSRSLYDLLEVKASVIELTPAGDGYELRVGDAVEVSARRAVPTEETVSCIVPGHHRPGSELYADKHAVREAPFEWELVENCAFTSTFDYRDS